MGNAIMLGADLESLPMTFRDPDAHRRPRLRYACVLECRAWVHLIQLDRRGYRSSLLRDARNIFCRAQMDLGLDVDAANVEAKAAIRQPRASMVVNGVRHLGKGAEGERFRVVAVDLDGKRVVAVVPAIQREISIQLSEL